MALQPSNIVLNSPQQRSFLNTPVYRLFLLVIAIIFISELLIMFILPLILPADIDELTVNLMDATLLSLLTSVTVLPLLMRFRRLASDSGMALDITSEGYWDVTPDGRIVDVNSGYFGLLPDDRL